MGFGTPPIAKPDFVHQSAIYHAPSFLAEPLSRKSDICTLSALCATADILSERGVKVAGSSNESRDRLVARIHSACSQLAPAVDVCATLASLGLLGMYPHLAARLADMQGGKQHQLCSASCTQAAGACSCTGLWQQPSTSTDSSSQPSSPTKPQAAVSNAEVASPLASGSKRPAHPGWSHLFYVALANQVVSMCGQLHADAAKPRHHRYIAHQLALLYQCLNMISPADTKPLRAVIEEQFDAIKQYAESKSALLPPEYCDWLQDVTWACHEEMAACPPYLRKRFLQAALVVGGVVSA